MPKWSLLYQEEFDDNNILIEEGEFAGLVIRFKRLGFVPGFDDSLSIKFEYDVINAGGDPGMAPIDLTSEHCRDTIIAVIKQYLGIGE